MGTEEEDGMTFSNLYGVSSFEGGDGDESSVDIYDGLDSTPVVSSNCGTKEPVKSSLNLFDEILIEEETAKEATFNELQAEHEKCKQQLQELMKKVQEIQEQNSLLQNENQSLKKNISALIKTARVEINRKDEEISNLQRRLTEAPVHHNTYSKIYTRNIEGSKQKNKSKNFIPENNSKTDPKNKQDLPRDVSHNCPSWDIRNKDHLEKKDTTYISRSHPEQLHKEGVQTELSKVDRSCDKEKEKRKMKNNEHHSKSNDCRYKTKTQRNVRGVVDCVLDTPGKSQVNPEKLVRNGQWKDRKDLKIKSSRCAENRTDNISSTKEKQSVPKDKLRLKTEHINEDRLEKLQITNQKDLKIENKEESSSRQKNRQPDKYVEQQRTGKATNTPENNTLVRNPKELSKGYLEDNKTKHNDCRKNKGTDDPGLQGGKSSRPHSSSRERKLSNSNKDSKKCEPERTHSKSDKYRTEAKRKSERDKPRERTNSQTERQNSKEAPQKTVKENSKLKDNAKREQKKPFPAKEIATIVEAVDEPSPIKMERDEDQSKSKDLKLSFMQKLNLTLSPAKKQTDKSKIVAETTNQGEMEVPSEEIMLIPNEPINATDEAKVPSGPIHNSPLQTKLEKTIYVSEVKANQQNETPEEILDIKPREAFPPNATLQNEMVGNEKLLPPIENEMQDSKEVHGAPSPANATDPETLLNCYFHGLETGSSVDSDTFRVIDEVNGTDSDSSMTKEEASNCADKKILEYSESESLSLHKMSSEDDKMPSVNISVTDSKAEDLNPSSPKHGSLMESLYNKGLNAVAQTRDSNPVSVDDDNSILSIDLNHMRYIPKAISPLNSPIRPLGKIFRMETSYKATNYNTDFAPDSAVDYLGSNHSSELNKENQKPLCSDHKILEESQRNIFSDELEEGEIVSDADDEPKIERKSENSKKLKRKISPERSNPSKNTYNQKVKSKSPNEDPGKLASGKKSKEKPKDRTIIFSKEMKKNKIVSIDYLEKIVQINAEPGTVHEFMQMLKAVRKQVRKNYMKFKIQFPIQQFHKIIDSSVLNFTSLIKYIDFSKMCKSNEAIKVNLCEVIESELNQIKKNTATKYLFEKQQSDMKKKLWKLVDEQLDSLFDRIKEILLKFCNLISLGNENDNGKHKRTASSKCLGNNKIDRQKSKKPSLSAKVKRSEEHVLLKPAVGSQLSKADHQEINKIACYKNTVTKHKPSHTNSTRPPLPEISHSKQTSTEDTALKTGKYEKEALEIIGDPHKSDISCGPLTEQQMSGLTFNLVNDAQMGEMFKSLLQGSGLSEKNMDFIDENQWEFRTPEKQMPEGQSGRNNPAYETEETVSRDIQIESRVIDGVKWPVVSPERDSTFLARLQMPIDPNILDENCMFEIPTSPTLKKGEVCVLEKQKSLVSSILLEDLAVSLTIPSPLKSDAHLSFLKPDVLGSVPEDVLNAHFSEDAHLEEEDASEQDIHLALESDNSSSKSSSSWANIPAAPGFQCCPSLPMQAVIMEKSNDHFIVKIRRAAPSISPTDQTAIPGEPPISVTEKGKNEITYEENLATLTSQSISSGEIEISKEIINTTDSEKNLDNLIMKRQVSRSSEPLKETSVCLAIDSVPDLFESQQGLHPDTPCDVIHTMESLLHKNRQEPSCDISLEVQRPFCNASQAHSPHLFVSDQALHNDAASEKPSDLLDPPEELRISTAPLEESSNEISQNVSAPEVFKLPQMIPTKVFQEKEVPSAKIKDFSVRSIVIPPVEQLSGQNHFDTNIGLTVTIPMEDKLDPTDPIKPVLNYRMKSVCKDQEKHKADSHCEVADMSKTEAEESINRPDASIRDGNFENTTTFNIDGQRCPMKLHRESKKRKNEAEAASSAKKQRKENNELDLKKPGKNCKNTKERTLVASNLPGTKPASTRDKDPLSSPSSMSPSNLCAKNIIKKKGEVVISWTRNDDRVILLECQKKGPSGKTFTSVAEQLKKTPAQVEERFKQLVKLFKMSNGS